MLTVGILFTLETVYAKEKLIVAFSILEPWKMKVGGKYEGAYAELAKEISHRVNMDIQFQVCPLSVVYI